MTTTTTRSLTTLDDVRSTYDKATQEWDGWSWTHSFGGVDDECAYCRTLSTCGVQIVIEPGDPDLNETPEEACEHLRDALDQAREYRDQCAADAQSAESEAAEALEAIDDDLPRALRHAQRAASIEREYGDSPTWGPLEDAIEQAIEDEPSVTWESHIKAVSDAVATDDLDGLIATLDPHLCHTRPEGYESLPDDWCDTDEGLGDGGECYEVVAWDETRIVYVITTPEGFRPHDCYLRVRDRETGEDTRA